MAVNDTKLRTLRVMQILHDRTDENHILNATDITNILENEFGMKTDRRTIYSEIDTLQTFGLDIIQKKGKTPGYYLADRQFELPELKLLVDTVQSAKFLTEKKSRELIRKLEHFCSRYEAEQLTRQVVIINRPKTNNETIYYNVDYIHTAIHENKKISFQYANWTPKKEMCLKRNGAYYVVSPWALTWDDENYYLVAYEEQSDMIKHYRVDKMQSMSVIEEARLGKESFEDFNMADFAKKTFGMYGGHDMDVILLCKNELAGVVLDRFGKDVWMMPVDDKSFKVRVKVSVSPQFFGWLTGIGAEMQILGPEEVKEEYAQYLRKILQNY